MVIGLTMLAAAGCTSFNNPEGWAGPAPAGDLILASIDKGELSALDPLPESDAECDNPTDDDGDGWVNEGCPTAGTKAESGKECRRGNDTSDDSVDNFPDDDVVNDGCPALVPLWTFPTGEEEPELDLEAIYTTPLVIDDTVYFSGYNGEVYALTLEDGGVRWSFEADGPIIADLAASETALYVASDDGRLYVLNPQTGQQVDTFNAGDSIWAAPLLVEEVLYVASVGGKLYALDAETLDPVWDAPFEAGQGLISDPVLAGGTVLVGGFDRALHAVDAATGQERWSFEADNWFWGRPLEKDGTVYAPNLDGHLYALSLADGKPAWDFPFESEDPDPLRSAPVLAGDVLVIVDRGGNVYGLDPKTGTRKWSKAVEKTVLSNPLALGEEVLISAQGGDLFRCGPQSAEICPEVTP